MIARKSGVPDAVLRRGFEVNEAVTGGLVDVEILGLAKASRGRVLEFWKNIAQMREDALPDYVLPLPEIPGQIERLVG